MIEAALKARVADPEPLRTRLLHLADEETSVYHDTYYDTRVRDLAASGRELRIRVLDSADGVRRIVLSYKEPPADAARICWRMSSLNALAAPAPCARGGRSAPAIQEVNQ